MHDYYVNPSDDHPDEARAIIRAQQLLEHFITRDDNYHDNYDDDDDDHGNNDDDHDNGEFDTISDFERRLQFSVIFGKYAYGILLLAVACVCFTLSAWLTHKLLY